MGNWLDAYLGRFYNNGSALEISAGVDCKDGIVATQNTSTNRIDLTTEATAHLKGIGWVYLTASESTPLTQDVWVAPEGSYAISSLGDAMFTLGDSDYPTVTYEGTDDARIVLVTSMVYTSASAYKKIAMRHYVNAGAVGITGWEYAAVAQPQCQSLNTLTEVESGDTFGVRITNMTDSADATINSLSMFFAALKKV